MIHLENELVLLFMRVSWMLTMKWNLRIRDKLNALLCKWKKDKDEVFSDWFLKNKVNVHNIKLYVSTNT